MSRISPDLGVRKLIAALDQALVSMPANAAEVDSRFRTVMSCRTILSRFGVDGESLVRYGMGPRASLGVFLAVISPDDDESTQAVDTKRWRELLKLPTLETHLAEMDEGEADKLSAAFQRVPMLLDTWVTHAPLAALLRFTPPKSEDWEQWLLMPKESEVVTSAFTWLWHRSVVDTLDRWTTASLHLEYKWQTRRQVGVFSSNALEEAGPDLSLLNAEVARRAVFPQEEHEEADDRLFWDLQEAAVGYLTKGRYVEAAALFEFHLQRHADDAHTLNNLGFCTMPISASKALHYLEAAARNGYRDPSISTYNRCCCLVRLNRAGDALDLAEHYWQRQRSENPRSGYLWVLREGEWTLTGNAHPEELLIDLAAQVAGDLGRPDRVSKWEARQEELRGQLQLAGEPEAGEVA